MRRVRYLLMMVCCLLLALGWATAAIGATISGMALNASGQTGRIYLRVDWEMGGPTNYGVSIATQGGYTIRGVPDNGTFIVRGFVDKTNDGRGNSSEAVGASGTISVSNGVVSGSPNLTLYAPGSVTPQPVWDLSVMPFDGGALLEWEPPEDQYGLVQADSYRIEWWRSDQPSTILSKTISASGGQEDGIFIVSPLTNGYLYYFRVVSIIGLQEAVSTVVSAPVATPVGGHTISGTIDLTGVFVAPNTPVVIGAEGPGGQSFYMTVLPSVAHGTPFTIKGVASGFYHLFALVDINLDNRPSAGDYATEIEPSVTVAGANVGGFSLVISNANAALGIETSHVYTSGSPGEYFQVGGWASSQAKRPVNIYVTGPQIPGMDLGWEGDEAYFWSQVPLRPLLTDQYSFFMTFSDGTVQTLTARPTAVYNSPVPNNIVPNGNITGMPANITWTPSAAVPAGWVAEAHIWGDNGFWWQPDEEPSADLNAVPYDGPPLAPGNYTLRVSLCEDWEWNCVGREQNFSVVAGTCAVPASLAVPAADADGNFTVSWGASATAGVAYVLQEATNSTFTAGLRDAYTGTARSITISGRPLNQTYYYRVRAVKTGYADSGYRTTGNGCAVPGTVAATPASLTVPAADADGGYTVSWGAAATAGATYVLQEATNPSFTVGLRTAYSGAARSAAITGRPLNKTYYYRVKAMKPGYKDSGYRTANNGCAVPGTAAAAMPASITVPASDIDGGYAVSWGAAATAGVTYVLEEATNPIFTAGVRLAYSGAALTANISGRAQNKTYYYRVKAIKAGVRDSAWRTAVKGCAVPGTASLVAPANLTVPANDADGAYAVTWPASVSAGVTYFLEEATNSTFTVGLRTAYFGAGLSASITGRVPGKTYYYRIQAVKAGSVDSGKRGALNGCLIGP